MNMAEVEAFLHGLNIMTNDTNNLGDDRNLWFELVCQEIGSVSTV